MAIEPFRQRIGIPDGAGVTSQGVGRVADLSGSFEEFGKVVMSTLEPRMKQRAVDAAKEAAAMAAIRGPDGKPIMPENPEGSGLLFNQVFDQLTEDRYVNELNLDFQNELNADLSERRAGINGKLYDPADFEAGIAARVQGILTGVDPAVRPQLEQTLYREGLERSRAFREEWSRTQRSQTIGGIKAQMDVYFKRFANYRDAGVTREKAEELYGQPLRKLAETLRLAGFVGQGEADALLMEVDDLTDGAVRYAEGLNKVADLIPLIGGLSIDNLDVLDNWVQGIQDPRGLNNVTREGVATARVTPESLRTEAAQLFPNAKFTSFDRAPDHPLSKANPNSYHNTANGGRAIDVAPIKGMTFEQYVARWKRAGYNVVEAKEEVGANRAAWATGDHWHIALGNTRKVEELRDNPQVQGLKFEDLAGLDPSVKSSLRGIITERKAVLRAEEAEARQQAAEAAREAREADRLQKVVDAITARDDNGLYGDFTGDEKKVLDTQFASNVNLAALSNDQEQAKAIQFVQQRGYLPPALATYMTNGIRSGDWRPAVQIYRGVKNATTPHGQVLGDLFVDELNPRTKAILEAASTMIAGGQPDAAVASRVEQLRSSNGFTRDEAQAAYNSLPDVQKTRGRNYSGDRDTAIRTAFGIPNGAKIPAWLTRVVDEGYAANLDIADGNPVRALQTAVRQNQGLYTRSNVFADGVGPSSLKRSYSNQQLADFFGNHVYQGKKLLPPSATPFKVGETIKLMPLDQSTGAIGEYEVRLFDPANPLRLIESYRLNLGAELRKWGATRRPLRANNPIEDARRNRGKTVETMKQVAGDPAQPFVGPKY